VALGAAREGDAWEPLWYPVDPRDQERLVGEATVRRDGPYSYAVKWSTNVAGAAVKVDIALRHGESVLTLSTEFSVWTHRRSAWDANRPAGWAWAFQHSSDVSRAEHRPSWRAQLRSLRNSLKNTEEPTEPAWHLARHPEWNAGLRRDWAKLRTLERKLAPENRLLHELMLEIVSV
jgi:hypothetical protein